MGGVTDVYIGKKLVVGWGWRRSTLSLPSSKTSIFSYLLKEKSIRVIALGEMSTRCVIV